MAGHSKWANIKHRKAAVDKKRSKTWSKIARAIIVAARGGGGDPATNLTLRYAIDEARFANMPRDTIERAIKRGTGELGAENYESVRYEGYGPGGVAVLVDCLTDNRTRTVNEVRPAFAKFGGSVGSSGCVAYLFELRGRIAVPAGAATEEQLMGVAIDAGASDVEPPQGSDGVWTIDADADRFQPTKEALEAAGIEILDAELAMVPATRVAVRGEDAKRVLALVDALEDLDDVQKVYTNSDIPAEELEALGE